MIIKTALFHCVILDMINVRSLVLARTIIKMKVIIFKNNFFVQDLKTKVRFLIIISQLTYP